MHSGSTVLNSMLSVAALVAVTAIATPSGIAQVPRTELHVIQTMTLTAPQFLAGAKDGKPVSIAGELRIPLPGTARLPAVILMHGTNGVGPNVDHWSQELNGMGMATFMLDIFTGRGMSNGGALTPILGTVNAYRALELLSKHPRIDPARIGIMGFSWGAAAALYSSMKRFHNTYGPAGVEFAAHLPFYAGCFTTYLDDTNISDKPIRMFHGAADDWLPVAPCRSYTERLRQSGKNIQLTEYPGAHHAFDAKALSTPVHFPKNQTPRACLLEEKPGAQMTNSKTGQAFTRTDPCIQFGTTMAYHAQAHADSINAVKEFLKATFKLQ